MPEITSFPISTVDTGLSVSQLQNTVETSHSHDNLNILNQLNYLPSDGAPGFSPVITVVENTPTSYILGIQTADNFFETPNLIPGDIRVPLSLTATFNQNPLPGQPVHIQAAGSGVQKTTLDQNGEFHTSLRPVTNYSFSLAPDSEDDFLWPVTESVTTGTLDIPLELNISTFMGNTHANLHRWNAINQTVSDNNGMSVTKTATTFGSFGSTTYRWSSGVLAPNGKIYCIPRDESTVLEIDPVTRTASTFGSLPSDDGKWFGGVLAPNGKIYCTPAGVSTVLEIDPVTRTTDTFGSLPSDDAWLGGVLAPNGKIYGIPSSASTVLEIDPVTRTTSTFGSLGSTTGGKWHGCLCQAENQPVIIK